MSSAKMKSERDPASFSVVGFKLGATKIGDQLSRDADVTNVLGEDSGNHLLNNF